MENPEHGSQGFFPLPRLSAIIVLKDFQNY